MTIEINTVVTEKRKVTKEITVPLYLKSGCDFFAITNEKRLTNVCIIDDWASISTPSISNRADEIGTAEKITEEDFFEAYNKAKSMLDNMVLIQQTV